MLFVRCGEAARRAAQRPTPSDQCHRGPFDPSPNYYLKMFFESRHTGVQSDLINAESPPTPLHCGEITPISAPAWLMATLINAEGVCPSGGPCGGGGSAEPAVAARASNHIHAHVPPRAALTCILSCAHMSLAIRGFSMWEFAPLAADADMEVWAVASVTNDTAGHRLYSHVWTRRIAGVQGGRRRPFASRAAGPPVFGLSLCWGERITTHRTFLFSPSTLSCNTQKSQHTPASMAKSSPPTCSQKIRQTHYCFHAARSPPSL